MPNAVVTSVHVYPVKSLAGRTPNEVAVEPWGLAADRRWMVVGPDDRAVTQRELPRMALASAEPLPGGAVRLSAAGREPLTVPVPDAHEAHAVKLFQETVELVPAGPVADDWLGDFLGTPVRLMHLDAPERRRALDPHYARGDETVSLADGFPLLVTTLSSLDTLNSLIARGDDAHEGPLPMNRFRPNVVLDGTAPWAEDGWERIRVGEVVFRGAKLCGRCVITTTDQRTAERGREPLRTLGRHRLIDQKLVFGRNMVPELPRDGGASTVRVGDPVEVLA
ncbi:MOSC N-terminal beta barrel domain-containing protein [Streptomyces sp. M19]